MLANSPAMYKPGMMQSASLFFMLLLASIPIAAAAEIYIRIDADPSGQIRIVTEDRREIVQKREPDQVGVQMPAISPDRRAAGWLALYPNCCTSYPIPLKLLIYTDGRIKTFTGNGLPVWRWRFLSGGKQIAFEQETVHGGLGVHYELRNVATGRLDRSYDPKPGTVKQPPQWAAELDSLR